MKILFIGDYSNLHHTLAAHLRKMGHQADVLSDGCGHMQLSSDLFIKRQPGIKGSFKYLFDLFNVLPKLSGYDAVQLINTNFLNLRPQKLKYFFDQIRKQNKSIFLTLAGNDYYFVKACHDAKIFRFSEFKVGNEFSPGHRHDPSHLYGWISKVNKEWSEYLIKHINGAMSVLPEYDMVARPILEEKVKFTNLPIDFSTLPHLLKSDNNKVNIMVAMRSGMEEMKGTNILYKIAKEIEKELPDKVIVDLVKDVSFQEFLSRMSKSDIVLDQLYSYSPAMTALYGMSMEKVVGTGAQPEYYEYIGNPENRPILALSPFDTDIKERIVELVTHPDKIKILGQQGREIVMKHNDVDIVSSKFLSHWQNLS